MKILIFLILISLRATFAAEQIEAPALEPAPNVVDLVHEKLSRGVSGISYRIDKFFGSKRAEDSANGTQIRLSYVTSKTEAEPLSHGGLIKYKLKLPYLESLFKISYSTDSEVPKKKPIKKDEGKKEIVAEGKKQQAPAPKAPPKLRSWGANVNTGIKLDIPPQFFANFRLRKSIYLGKWEFRGAQEFFWFSRDGFGETTTFDMDRPINTKLLFRLRNSVTWTDSNDTFASAHGPILFWQLDPKKAFSFSATAIGSSRPFWKIDSYLGAINYRQLLYKRWFYLETGPSVTFERVDNWSPVLSYFLKFEVLIGNY